MSPNGSSMFNLLSLLIVVGLVSGCASGAGTRAPVTSGQNVDSMTALSGQSTGSTVNHRGINYTIVSAYFAASGKECKVLSESGGGARVACQSESGSWYLRPSLQQSTDVSAGQHSQPTIAPTAEYATTSILAEPVTSANSYSSGLSPEPNSSPSGQIVELESVETVLYESGSVAGDGESVALQTDETLWKFSKRVTGNALNWKRIAEFNGLEDVKAVKAGDYLMVPADLLIVESER